jgi:predicted ester cyclase
MRVRGLRAWRFLPLGLGFAALLATVPQVPLLLVEPGYTGYESETMQALEELALLWYLLPIPLCLGSLLLVRPLLWAPRRERALVEAENLSLANHLYREAWVGGDLAIVDEVFSTRCEDRYGNGCGPDSVKRSVAGLRKSFPDLGFCVESQEADGKTVRTRWTASGTDLGGVLWYPPTGRSASFGGEFVDRFEGDRIVEHDGRSDTAGLLEQLGLPRG